MLPSRFRLNTVGPNTAFRFPSPAMCPGSRMIGEEGSPKREKSPALVPPTVMELMVRLQVPVFDTGNGCSDVHAPTLWITVGGKANGPGTSIDGDGVLPASATLFVVSGTPPVSLVTVSV